MTTHEDTHLAREIAQQPRIWREVSEMVASRRSEIDAFLAPLLSRADARIVLTGAGTSAFAGEVAAPELSRHLGRRVEAVATTDLLSNPYEYLVPDVPTLLVSFARSGNSPESVATVDVADQILSEVSHLIIACNAEGQLTRHHGSQESSLVLLLPPEANDASFAMTSSFTGMTITALLALRDPKTSGVEDIEPIAAAAEQLLQADEVDALAELSPDRVIYLGSGPLHGLAQESALKLLELTAGQIIGLAESSLGFRHGPKSVLTPQTLVVVYLSKDPYTRRYDIDIATELTATLGERVVAVDGSAETPEGKPSDVPSEVRTLRVHGVGSVPDAYWAVAAVIVAQRLAMASSLALGLPPDNPFPGGEVNRVVQGVTVHPLPSTS